MPRQDQPHPGLPYWGQPQARLGDGFDPVTVPGEGGFEEVGRRPNLRREPAGRRNRDNPGGVSSGCGWPDRTMADSRSRRAGLNKLP